MRRIVCIVISSVVIFLIGCGPRYIVGNETFSSSSEALQKMEAINASILKDITTTNNPLHGTVLVVVPSDIEIQKNYIRYRGNPSKIDKTGWDFAITAVKKNFQVDIDAIKKRGIFSSVSVANHNGNPASFSIGEHDFIVFFDVDGWFIRGTNKPRPLPIDFPSKLSGSARIIAFLESLSQQADAIGNKR